MVMSRVVVLGGCGAVGSVAVKALATHEVFDEVVIADANTAKSRTLVATLGSPKVKGVPLDAEDFASIKEAVRSADVVLNCVGPFYKTVKTVVSAIIESGINYVDVCDDVDVTLELLGLDETARNAGITALIGMGSSPGVTNVLAKLAAESLLDETDSVDIFHAHGGEPFEGEGVVGHRFHCMSIPIPMFLDGQMRYVDYFGADGIALRQTFDFPVLGPSIPIYPYPHPEQVTIPRFIKVRQVTNKGTVLPNEYYNLTREMCQLGLSSKEPVDVKGQTVTPHDFAIAYIIKQREKILRETHFGEQRGCVSVIVKGKKDGAYKEYRFHLASRSQALGEGTGIPAAIGVVLMKQGKIKAKGVLPPEACIEPFDFIGLVPTIMELDKQKEGGQSFGGIIVQEIGADGTVTNVDI
jgi:saccharopine dehydrogenase (NAD+, L-lysine-forming)